VVVTVVVIAGVFFVLLAFLLGHRVGFRLGVKEGMESSDRTNQDIVTEACNYVLGRSPILNNERMRKAADETLRAKDAEEGNRT
jgi:hypothetical protein